MRYLLTIKNDDGADLTAQRAALIALGSRGAVMYRLADDNLANKSDQQSTVYRRRVQPIVRSLSVLWLPEARRGHRRLSVLAGPGE